MRKNEPIVVTGLGAAVLSAEIHIGKRPGSKPVEPFPTINWEDAPEEMRNDPKVMWIINNTLLKGSKKYTFRKHTEEELKEIHLNKIYKLEHMFDYILKKYGWRYAKEFYEWDQWKKEFDECGIIPNLNIPHCKYEINHQCDIECPFFKSYCTYREEE